MPFSHHLIAYACSILRHPTFALATLPDVLQITPSPRDCTSQQKYTCMRISTFLRVRLYQRRENRNPSQIYTRLSPEYCKPHARPIRLSTRLWGTKVQEATHTSTQRTKDAIASPRKDASYKPRLGSRYAPRTIPTATHSRPKRTTQTPRTLNRDYDTFRDVQPLYEYTGRSHKTSRPRSYTWTTVR